MAFGDLNPKFLGGTTVTALVSTGDDELTLKTAAPITGGDRVQIQFTANSVVYDIETGAADASGNYVATATDIRINLAAEEDNILPITLTVNSAPNAPPFLSDAIVWLDPTDNSKMWQDIAKTIPVTTDGDPIAVWEDSNGGGDWTQSDNTRRPTWRTTYVEFNNDWLIGPDLTGQGTTPGTFMAAIHAIDVGGVTADGWFAFNDTDNSGTAAHWGQGGTGRNYSTVLSPNRQITSGALDRWADAATGDALVPMVYAIQNNGAASGWVQSIDNVDWADSKTLAVEWPSAPVIGGTRRLGNISSWAINDGRMYGFVVYNIYLSAPDRTMAFNYLDGLLP